MKTHPFTTTVVLLALIAASTVSATRGSELADAIEPLEKPDLPAAKVAIRDLDRLIENTSGNKKVVAQRVRTALKNTFTAEHQVTKASDAAEKAEKKAVEQELSAADYLKRNKFGRIRYAEANRCREEAKKIREEADTLILDKRVALLAHLKELDTLANDFFIERAAAETVILHHVVEAITTRSLGDVPFTPTLTSRSVESLRELAVFIETWEVEAQQADKAGNFEKAFELYTKVGNRPGRQKAAKALARELEEAEFFGSAIEYYEKGGDYETAKALRREHPELLAESFKKLNGSALYAKVAPCVVKIRAGQSLGSGFVFRRNGYIMTNAHVVEDDVDDITVLLDNDRNFPAELKAIDKERDLAVIRVETRDDLDYLRFAHQDEVEIGTEIAAVGYPKLDLPTATMNTGAVSNDNRSFQGTQLVQIDVSINKGNSGGPIVDQRGRVMGIVTLSFDRALKADRFNFAVSLLEIERFLKSELGEDFISR